MLLRASKYCCRTSRPLHSLSSFRFLSNNLSSNDEVLLQPLDGDDTGIVLLTMNRPRYKNALGKNMVSQFESAITKLKKDYQTNKLQSRIVIINSAVDGVFCAGADLKERELMSNDDIYEFVNRLRQTFTGFEDLPQPVIASMDGAAMGGGLEMALAADIRIGGSKSKYGLPETSLAIIPGAGGTQRLPRLIGIPKAKELILTSKRIDVHEALQIGLINDKTDDVSSMDLCMEYARLMLKTGPIALTMAKESINEGMQCAKFSDALIVERNKYKVVIPTNDRVEAIRAFQEKRTPNYTGT